MNTRSMLATTALVATVGLTLSACGGSSSGGSALNRADLAAKANSICQSLNTQADAVPTPSSIQDASQAADFFDKLVPILSSGVSKLKALKPDADVKTDWDAFITAENNALTFFQGIKTKADNADPSGLQDLGTKTPALEQAVKDAATKVGATTCTE
jgi:hypothetical protein